MKHALQHILTEWSCSSSTVYADPFNDIEMDVVIETSEGAEMRVPAFWSGAQTWRVRYSSPVVGTHRYRTVCSDEGNPDLHGLEGEIEVRPYDGGSALMRRGPLRVADDGRRFEHRDGTPFFWLSDTWWMSLCRRLSWPGDFRTLTADRVAKGFTVIQLVAGLYPDMPPFDRRGANEAGFPWEEDFSRINPDYFDMADLRIDFLVQSGLVPCIVACWGYFLPLMGIDKMKKHWRYLLARYGAYPVVWCAAGEGAMPYYLSENVEEDAELQKTGWTELVRYVRQTDPYHHLVTIHPTRFGHEQVDDPSVLDFDMLQPGHKGFQKLALTVDMVSKSLAHEPRMPVLVSEVCYEGIMETNREEMQRFLFWSCMLSGAAGHGYGANGLWQVNSSEEPYGLSPHGTSWGDTPWQEAYQLPGSGQQGLGKSLLERYPWWRFKTHLEWIEPHQTAEDRQMAYAAGIPGELRVFFLPIDAAWLAWSGEVTLKGIEPDVRYRGFYFSPKTGKEYDLGTVTPDAAGDYAVPKPPIFQDWVVVLEGDR